MTHIDNTARVAVEGSEYESGWRGPGWTYPNGKILPPMAWTSNPLDMIPDEGFVYMGSPYSLYRDGYDEAARLASLAAAALMFKGLVVYAPIPHGHAVAMHGVPATWDFWHRPCAPFIEAASALVVLKLEGWRDSVGLTYEIARFHEAGKPIVYVTMEELANG